MRELTRELNESVANYQQTSTEDPLSETPGQSNEPFPEDVDQGSELSDISDLGATPEHPGFFGDDSIDAEPTVAGEDVEVGTLPVAPAALTFPIEADAESQAPSHPATELLETVSHTSDTPATLRRVLHLKLSPAHMLAISQTAPSPTQTINSQGTFDPTTTLLTPTSVRQRSSRPKKQPVRFRKSTDAPAEAIDGKSVHEDTVEPAGESPSVQKAARKPRAKAKPRTKAPVSSEKVTEEDLADDVPAPVASKAPRKRKAGTSEPTPRKNPATPRTKAKAAKDKDTPAPTPSFTLAVESEALLALPSPPTSQSELEAEFPIDADLLKLSRAMTYREPLVSKPEPFGKPKVWAPGRQELCETLPYYKSAHSGCYMNDGSVYAFMLDSTSVVREYMDSDVIIARMGGLMEADETGSMYQKDNHLLEAPQPQSVLNNIVHKNPLVIICGDKNECSITKMPHRYCVLDWFKPTHVWGEKTMGKVKRTMVPVTTIRFRFERLDRSKQPWYRPVPAAGVSCEPTSSAELESPAESSSPGDLSLPVQKCTACSKSCSQVYLIDWLCTNPNCTSFWKLSNGQDAPYDELDYHPAFLQQRATWECEDPPFDVNPGLPQVDQHFGDSLSYVSTRGVVCPKCGRCNTRYMFTHWRCDTAGCKWKLVPQVQVVMPSNLAHTPWDVTSDGPSLARAVIKPAVHTQIKYFSNYKVIKYTIEGVAGSVIVAKANKHVVSEPGGANDMFREIQTANIGLERRILRKAAKPGDLPGQTAVVEPDEDIDIDGDEDDGDHQAEGGARMTAFGMNFGMPYKFVASGDSQSFESAPAAVRAVRARLNWAQHAFVNDESGYQDFNEELIFAYLQGQKIKYHDDGEEGLGPRIATLSLGAPATMLLRLKAKYFSQVSKGKEKIFTDEKPLPLPVLESSGYASGHKRKLKDAATASSKPKPSPVSKDTHAARLGAWEELQSLRQKGDMAAFRARAKKIPGEIDLCRKEAKPLLSFHLTHGDIVIMEGEDIQKFLEHSVEPHGHLRFAMTCRTILPGHLKPDQLPAYEVLPDAEGYDGSGIREARDGEREAVVWE